MNAAAISFNSAQGLDWQKDDYKAWYNKGEILAKSGQYTEALANFNRALAEQPTAHAAWIFKGVVLVQLGRYAEALTCCEQALAIAPHDKQAWIIRGAALNYMGCYQDSYACYDRALGVERRSRWQELTQMVKRLLKFNGTGIVTDTTTITTSASV